VRYVPADQVAAAYRRGESGDTVVSGDAYRVKASRRDAPGEPEIHLTEADIFYVLDGQATLVTGGELIEPRNLTPSEIRGSSIRGGTERQLAHGDVIAVPAGVPHWFKQVTAPFRYYVVKSGAQGG
jgi:glc operon protein GlcG